MTEDVISKFFWNFQIFYCVWRVFRIFASFIPSNIISLFLSKVIFTLDLFSEKETVLRSARTSCYQWYSFHLTLQNIAFFLLKRDKQKLLCLVKANLFSSVGFVKNMFLKTRSFQDRLRQRFNHSTFYYSCRCIFFSWSMMN